MVSVGRDPPLDQRSLTHVKPLSFHSLNAGSMREGGEKGLARTGLDGSSFLCLNCIRNCDEIVRELATTGVIRVIVFTN